MHTLKKDVEIFLRQLKEILCSDTFNIDTDITIQYVKKKDNPLSPFTTQNTLLKLDYDINDVVKELKTLTVKEYYETLFDERGMGLPLFFVFGKEIEKNDVYIKVKIKEKTKQSVFCISFHFAENPMIDFPYA
jgi:hypothetical protein